MVRTPTRRTRPSENCSVSSASCTPTVKPLVSGCTTMRVGCVSTSVAFPGMKFRASFALDDVKLET